MLNCRNETAHDTADNHYLEYSKAGNLGIKTYLNGTLTSNIVIDTTQAATDTIDYVATDQTGLTATSTRTVIIEATSSIVPTDDASTTATTTTP